MQRTIRNTLTAYFMQGGIMGPEGIIQKGLAAYRRRNAVKKEAEKA